MLRVAINGYGRIGRVAHRVILQWHSDEIDVVAINAGHSTDLAGWMYLLKYDSVYGLLPQEVSTKPSDQPDKKDLLGYLVLNNKSIPVYSQKDPTLLPWRDLGVDVVIESTGAFTTPEKLKLHLQAGAKKVILSAPVKDGEGVPTYVTSVNDADYKGETVVSNASCTTNCITPVAKIIEEHFGIEKAMMTTIHGYTSDQRLQDGGHKDYRRARAAGLNIVPTSTGATIAAGAALPALKGIFEGLSIRVPVPVGSLSDFTFLLKRDVTKEEVIGVFKKEAQNPVYQGILAVTEDPLVSSDIIGNSHSSIVDLSLTQVVGGNMLKVIAWYDNEYGYANRLVEEVVTFGQTTVVSAPQPIPTPDIYQPPVNVPEQVASPAPIQYEPAPTQPEPTPSSPDAAGVQSEPATSPIPENPPQPQAPTWPLEPNPYSTPTPPAPAEPFTQQPAPIQSESAPTQPEPIIPPGLFPAQPEPTM